MALDLNRDLVVRWDAPETAHVPLLKQVGASAVVAAGDKPGFAEACATAGLSLLRPSDFQFLAAGEWSKANAAPPAALTNGIWPGIGKLPSVEGRGDETASASVEPWVDANGFWVGYLKALYPQRPPVLAYLPDKLGDRAVPFDTLELALIEAWTAGGNYLLAVEKHYREALVASEPKALAAWKQLGQTARWLRENISLFRQPTVPIVTALVEPGEETAELANLMYRRNVSPALAASTAVPLPNPGTRRVVVAANLKQVDAALARRILAHAEMGSAVVVASNASEPWWRVPGLKLQRSQRDREFYTLGKGQVVAYRETVADPSEFAMDVIDIVHHTRRAVRLWNALTVIALATASPRAGERLLHLVNYGSEIDTEIQVRVQGAYGGATLLRPNAAALPLKAARRGTTTEVFVPELKRFGVLVFR
jgi:hypothetical protein